MNKLTSLDTSTLADTYYDVKVDADIKADTGPICVGRGLWDQMYIFNYKPLTIIEIGDYSMLVKESYTPSRITDVKGNKVVESITTSEGTILYFSDKLPEEMKYYSTIYANVRRVLNMSLLEEMIQKQFVSPSIGGGRNVKMKNNNGKSK